MTHKTSTGHAELRFAGGTIKHVVASRRELAKRLCALEPGQWLRLASPLGEDADAWSRLRAIQLSGREQRAAKTLEGWGMLVRNPIDSNCVKWADNHERPIFGQDRETHEVNGHRIYHLSPEQKMLITLTMMAAGRRMRHEVLCLGDEKMRRMIRSLVKRGILTVIKRESVWALGLGEQYQNKVAT